MSSVKAVIFDIGGVVVGSPISAIHQYEVDLGLRKNQLNLALVSFCSNWVVNPFLKGQRESMEAIGTRRNIIG